MVNYPNTQIAGDLSHLVTLTGTVSVGDWVCSANDPTDPSKVSKATASNLLNANAVIGVMLQDGYVGQQKLMAPLGFMVSSTVTGIVVSGVVASTGTTPPVLTLTGTATTSYNLRIECTLLGARGVWQFRWSINGGVTWVASNVVSAATVALTGTGLTLNIATGNAAVDNVWTATNYTNIILNTTTARAARGNPLSTDYVLGSADGYGNLKIHTRTPGTIVDTNANNSTVIAGDGYAFRSRKGHPNLLDYFRTYGGADDRSTDCSDAINAMIADAGGVIGGTSTKIGAFAEIPPPRVGFLCKKPIFICDDGYGGNVQNFTLLGPHTGLPNHGISIPTLFFDIPQPLGSAATIIDFTNGGSGINTQTIQLGAGSSLITASNKLDWIGAWIEVWHTNTIAHTGQFQIVNVPFDGYVRIAQPLTGGFGSTDGYNGTIRWRVIRPCIQIRGRSNGIRGVSLQTNTGATIECGIELNSPSRLGASGSWFRNFVENCHVGTDTPTTKRLRDGIWVGRQTVATYAGAAQNGRGDYVSTDAGQGESWRIENTSFGFCERANIAIFNEVSGQAKTGLIRNIELYAAIGIAFYGVGSGDIEHCQGVVEDTGVIYASPGSVRRRVDGLYLEQASRLIFEGAHDSRFSTTFNNLSINSGECHPSGEILSLNGIGPYEISGGNFAYDGNSSGASDAHIAITCGRTLSRGIATLAIEKCNFNFASLRTSQRGHASNDIIGGGTNSIGPYVMTGTETLPVIFNSSGVTRTITFTANNFARANINSAVSTVDLNSVSTVQVGRVIDGAIRAASSVYDVGAVVRPYTDNGRTYICTSVAGNQTTNGNVSSTETAGWTTSIGTTITDGYVTWTCCEGWRAWGDAWLGGNLHIETRTEGSAGRVQVVAGSSGNSIFGFSTILQPGSAVVAISTDTLGYVLPARGSFSFCNVDLSMRSNTSGIKAATSCTKIPNFSKCYTQNPNVGGRYVEAIRGLSGYTNVGNNGGLRPENLSGFIDIVDGYTTGTVTFPFAEPDGYYMVSSLVVMDKVGAPATKSAKVVLNSRTTAKFDVVLDAAPGIGTSVTVFWMITR